MTFNLRAAALAALALAAATAADATTYLGTRTIGAGSVNLSITTDGTLGVVRASNILDWTIVLNGVSTNATLTGPLSGNNSTFTLSDYTQVNNPTALTATATNLSFDYGNYPPGFFLTAAWFIFNAKGSGLNFCMEQSTCSGTDGGHDSMNFGNGQSYRSAILTGVQVIGSVKGGAVPEPASWALMILGFGLAGSTLRTRRRETTRA